MIDTLIVLVPLALQSAGSGATASEASPASPTSSANIEDLRARIHGMRMSLLFGGDKVKGAEIEAMGFYRQRIESVNQGLDSIHTDLAEKGASYDAALRQALSGKEGAMQRAQTLRAEIASLEQESSELSSTSANLAKLVQTVQARQREREVLAARLESPMNLDLATSFTLGSVGLAPDVQVRPDTSPFDDPSFVQDLFARDPVAAARLLYATDAERYLRTFPLQPPAESLRTALAFPLPDLPGKR